MTPAIEIRGLHKCFERFTLGPLDLTVPVGAIYGLVGANGAGKTTTIDLMFGIGAKDSGTIRVHGFDHRTDDLELKRRSALVSPNMIYAPWKKVGRAIDFVRRFHPTWDQAYCERLMRDFGLAADDKIMLLSSGARTKLTLLLALAWRPPLLVLDEPTNGLDAIARRQMFAELLAAVRDEQRTVFISSHAIQDLERVADVVGLLHRGRLVAEGRVDALAERFRLIDFTLDVPVWQRLPGVVVQAKDGDRWRVLLDRQHAAVGDILSRGARQVDESAIALEDLCVAIGRA